jgi:hypothetical protein
MTKLDFIFLSVLASVGIYAAYAFHAIEQKEIATDKQAMAQYCTKAGAIESLCY